MAVGVGESHQDHQRPVEGFSGIGRDAEQEGTADRRQLH